MPDRKFVALLVSIAIVSILLCLYLFQPSARIPSQSPTGQIQGRVQNAGSAALLNQPSALGHESSAGAGIRASQSMSVDALVRLPVSSYADILEITRAADLHKLYELLRDERYIEHWGHIADLIGFAGESNESSKSLVEFIRENQGWKGLAKRRRWYFFEDKMEAINWLGLTKGPDAEKVLLELIEPAKAEDLLNYWSSGATEVPWDGPREATLSTIQGRAAQGLLLMNNPTYDEIVKRRLDSIALESKRFVDLANSDPNNRAYEGQATLYTLLEDKFYSGIIMQRYLRAHGIEATKKIFWEPDSQKNMVWSEALGDPAKLNSIQSVH